MRGTTPGLRTPYPLGSLLPPVFQEDELLMRFTGAMDQLLAPAIASLDCLAAYVDPALAPPDYLGWLAQWVGVELDERWSVEQQREVIAEAVDLHRVRGTVEGLRRQLAMACGGEVEVFDTACVSWSLEPVDELPEPAPVGLTVVVRGGNLSEATLNELVDAAKPASVVHEVRVEELPD